MPEEILQEPAPPTSASIAVVDNWVRMARANRVPFADSIRTALSALRVAHIENGARVARIQPPCNAKCQARLEYAELKLGVVYLGKIPTRVLAQKITPHPIASTVTTVAKVVPNAQAHVLAIGDSVMLGASAYLRKGVAAIDVDAKLGRQVSAALKILRERQNANLIPPVVIVHLGNNGTFSVKQFDEMMTLLRDVPRVIFLTTKVPRKWQEPNNNALAEGVKRYPNATLVDWNGTSVSHPEWFWKDGIHLRPEGAKVYANLIAGMINQARP